MRRQSRHIHELPDWPNFGWDQQSLASVLATVRHQQGRLIGRMEGLGFPLQQEAVLQTLTEDVVKRARASVVRHDSSVRRWQRAHRTRDCGYGARAVLKKARFWQTVRDVPINGRQRLVLNRVLDGFEGKLTTSKWVTIAKCSSDTALRDIVDLVERGVLVRNPGAGRNTSYSLAEVR